MASRAANKVLEGFDEYKDKMKDDTKPEGSLYRCTPKYQKSTKNNPLCGICFPQWWTLLRTYNVCIAVYWPRLLVITMLSILNSALAAIEDFFYASRIAQTNVHPAPVFILGHPRTGSTLLHSLLALDENFSFCSTFCAGFPSCFLWFESLGKYLFVGVMDDTRPMDNVPLDFDLPQEDEIATNVWSLRSPYLSLFFPNEQFNAYFAFDENANNDDEGLPADVMASARTRWTKAFLFLLKKLTYRAELQKMNRSRLLLKSPVHTARIPLLLKLFPNAQFVYIHRNPYDVFQSAMHMADTTYWYTYLQTPSEEQIQEFVLRQYEILWDRYQEGKELLDSSSLVEVSYNELTADPERTLQKIYDSLQWKISDDVRRKWKDNTKDKSYKTNRHRELSPELRRIVAQRWRPSFAVLGYAE